MTETAHTVADVDAIECAFEPLPWRFATDNAEAIDTHWTKLVAARPEMFNGRVLLQHRGAIDTDADGRTVFRGAYLEADFKAFLAWRDFGYPVRDVRNGFAMAALRGSDGGFLLGEMGQHTANAGRIYFPSGTPDPSDVVGHTVDIEGSARRELVEETGLDPGQLGFSPGLTVIQDAFRVCCIKLVHSTEPSNVLAERIHTNLAAQDMPELARMHIVRRNADITDAMPFFVAAYLRRVFAAD